MSLSRAYTSAKAADVAKLLLVTFKQMPGNYTSTHAEYFSGSALAPTWP